MPIMLHNNGVIVQEKANKERQAIVCRAIRSPRNVYANNFFDLHKIKH